MVKKFIKKIRRQPKVTRDKIALGTAGVFTAIVFSVWAYHVPARMSELTKSHEDSSPGFSQLFKEIGDQVSSVKDALPGKEAEEVFLPENESQSLLDTQQLSSSSTMATKDSSSTTAVITEGQTPSIISATSSMDQTSSPISRSIRVVTTSSTASSNTPEVE